MLYYVCVLNMCFSKDSFIRWLAYANKRYKEDIRYEQIKFNYVKSKNNSSVMNTNLSKQLEILNACKDGAIIQVKHRDNNSTWCDIKNTHIFNFEDYEYRIKPKSILPINWIEYCNNNKRTNKFFIDQHSNIDVCAPKDKLDSIKDKNLCDSYEEAEAFRALMQLRLLRKAYIGDWEADFTNRKSKFCICNVRNNVFICNYTETNHCLSFPTAELAEKIS